MNSMLRAINNIQELEPIEQDVFSKLYKTPRYTILVTPCINEIRVLDRNTHVVYYFTTECKFRYKYVL